MCEQFFGFRSFSVHVTVIDAVRQQPIARMRELMRLARAAGATHLFRFTLGGWLFAYGMDTTWFDATHAPVPDSVCMQDHDATPISSVQVATAEADVVASPRAPRVALRHDEPSSSPSAPSGAV